MLRSTYYDEENDIYYKENVDGKLKEVSELQLSSETKSTYVTLEIFGQGLIKSITNIILFILITVNLNLPHLK